MDCKAKGKTCLICVFFFGGGGDLRIVRQKVRLASSLNGGGAFRGECKTKGKPCSIYVLFGAGGGSP